MDFGSSSTIARFSNAKHQGFFWEFLNFSVHPQSQAKKTASRAVSSSSFRGDIRKASLSASGAIGSAGHGIQDGPALAEAANASFHFVENGESWGLLARAKHGKDFGRKRRRRSRHIPNRALECKTVLPNGTQRPYVVSVNSLEASESAWKNPVAFHLWANLGYFHLQTWFPTSTWEIPLKDGHQNRSKSVVLVAASSFSSASGWSSLRSCQVSQVKPGAEVWERGHAFQSVFNQLPRFGDQKQKLSHYPLPSGNSTWQWTNPDL